MAAGGARPGAGRKPGGRNRITQEAIAKARDGLSPLDYLLSVMRDAGAEEARRIDAAKAAAPYCHAKLQPVDGDGDATQKHEVKGALTWQAPS
jgi:hypothetical protein